MKRIILQFIFPLLFIATASAGERFWVGGSGNWNDASHWSERSGGSGGAPAPTANDNAIFDSKSFPNDGDQVAINGRAECRNLIWKDIVYYSTLTGSAESSINIYGSLAFVPELDNKFQGKIFFKSSNQGNTIYSANHFFHCDLIFDNENGK